MGIIKSFYYALRGLGYVLKSERNAKIHLFVALAVLALGLVLKISNLGLAAMFFAVVIVFLAEIINTAFEKTLDLVDPNNNPEIEIIKDMVAGSVLVAAGAAVLIGLVIFLPALLALL